MTRVSIFMPSFNKPGYVVQGIRSVIDQTEAFWELWVMDNSTDTETRLRLAEYANHPKIRIEHPDLGPEIRAVKDPPVYLCNQYYPYANGDIIIYMSDDDLLAPGLVARVIEEFDAYEDCDAVYWNSLVCSVRSPEEHVVAQPWIMATMDRGQGQLDCCVDGGQIAVKKRAFERLEQPWFPEDLALGMNSHSDGVLMSKLADSGVVFHPIDYNGLIHRRTPISTYTKG